MCPLNFKEIPNLGKNTHTDSYSLEVEQLAPENRPGPFKEAASSSNLPIIIFQGRAVKLQGRFPKLDIRFPKVEDGIRPDITDGTSDDDGFILVSKLEGPNMKANKHEISPGKSNRVSQSCFHMDVSENSGFPPKASIKR